MNADYKLEIKGKLLKIVGLIYFAIGFFSTYAWACKELDKISLPETINKFWNPISISIGTINFLNFILFIFLISKAKRHHSTNLNNENRILFYVLCSPLFLATIAYTILELIFNGMKLKENNYTFLMVFGEMFLFIGTQLVVININFKIWDFIGPLEKLLSQFVLLTAIIGMINCFIFHLTAQQISNFIDVASNYQAYSKFYNNSKKSTDDPFNFSKIKQYMQPLVVLFCCTCMVYIIKFSFSKEKSLVNSDNEELIDQFSYENDSDNDNPTTHENQLDKYDNKKMPTFRLPPLSLIIGILLITLSLLAVAILNSLLSSKSLYVIGQLLTTSIPIPIYIVSIILLYMQIIEMEKWPKLRKNKNIVDRTLVWVGTIGQLTIALSQIELYSFIDDPTLTAVKDLSSIILMIQSIIQILTISLALDREWIPPERKSWQEYVCPAVGLLSINISLLVFNIFMLMNNVLNSQISHNKIQNIFLIMFGNGFHSLGETLAILQRLHSSLIFVKMIVYTNN